MSTIKSSAEDLTLNADGSGNDIKFQSNGVEKASLTDGGVFTATSFAGSGANLTNIPATDISGKLNLSGGTMTGNLTVSRSSGDAVTRLQGASNSQSSKLFISHTASGSGGLFYNDNVFDIFSYGDIRINSGTGNTGNTIANERIRIRNDGRVGIGTSSPQNPLEVSGDTNYLMRLTQTGTNKHMLKTVGNGASLELICDGANNYVGLNSTTNGDDIRFQTNDGNERMRMLAAGGLTFNGDTAAANALDDYEEGTWTPNISAVNGGTTATYGTNNSGTYTKIGNTVFFSGFLQLNNKGNLQSGAVFIRGLPFNMNTTQANQGSGATVVEYGNFNTNFNSFVLGYLRYDRLGLRYTTGSGTSVYTNVVESAMGQDAYFRFHGQYNV